jgi:hypothetical protein
MASCQPCHTELQLRLGLLLSAVATQPAMLSAVTRFRKVEECCSSKDEAPPVYLFLEVRCHSKQHACTLQSSFQLALFLSDLSCPCAVVLVGQ